GLVHNVSYRDVCIRDVKNPIVMDPFYSTERGLKPPDFRDIRLQNVFIATPGKITLLGLDADHPLKITFDQVRVNGLRPDDIRAAHSRIALGKGGASFKVAGEDVAVSGVTAGESRPRACAGAFVPFSAGSLLESDPYERRAGQSKENSALRVVPGFREGH